MWISAVSGWFDGGELGNRREATGDRRYELEHANEPPMPLVKRSYHFPDKLYGCFTGREPCP